MSIFTVGLPSLLSESKLRAETEFVLVLSFITLPGLFFKTPLNSVSNSPTKVDLSLANPYSVLTCPAVSLSRVVSLVGVMGVAGKVGSVRSVGEVGRTGKVLEVDPLGIVCGDISFSQFCLMLELG